MIETTELYEIRQRAGGYSLLTDGPEIRLLFLTDDIVRMRASFDGKYDEESYALVMTAWEDRMDEVLGKERRRVVPLSPSLEETEERAVFSAGRLSLSVNRRPFGIEIFDRDGNRLYADVKGRSYQKDHLGRVYHYLERGPADRYYGFGETAGHLDKADYRVRLSPKDAIGYDPEKASCLYKHIPFYIRFDGAGRRASGLFYHNFWDAEFVMGSEISGYWPPYTYYAADGGDVDLFFVNGPGIDDVVRRYTDLTGKTIMQPRYSLGYLGSTMYYSELPADCDAHILDFIDRNREEGIPVDGFQLSSGYCAGADGKRHFFTWNSKRFPNPERFFKEMAKRGISVSPNIKPGMLLTHPDYAEVDKAGGFIRDPHDLESYVDRWWGGKGSFFDFTNPAGRRAWMTLMKRRLLAKGVTSLWN
ncbi:MAG: DUF4968 domain-containing protein, partial [Planctomycetota bacterium]|nr:DUF4968 domain-containing protein [Planctomycetota bacterium]